MWNLSNHFPCVYKWPFKTKEGKKLKCWTVKAILIKQLNWPVHLPGGGLGCCFKRQLLAVLCLLLRKGEGVGWNPSALSLSFRGARLVLLESHWISFLVCNWPPDGKVFLKETPDIEDVKVVVHRARGAPRECDFPTAESFCASWRQGSEMVWQDWQSKQLFDFVNQEHKD